MYLAVGSLPYLRFKFCWAEMSDFVSINQETNLAFSCGVLIFTNSTFVAKFERFWLITPQIIYSNVIISKSTGQERKILKYFPLL